MLRFRSRGLRFRDLGASFSRFGCMLRASVFVSECFVFGTTHRHVTKLSIYLSSIVHYFYTKISSFTLGLSIKIVLEYFCPLVFYFEKFAT